MTRTDTPAVLDTHHRWRAYTPKSGRRCGWQAARNLSAALWPRLVALAVAYLICCTPALAQPRSIEAFVASKDKWGELVGTTWRLEGRYGGITNGEMRFVNCDLPFVFEGSAPRTATFTSNVVEVSGELQRVKGKLQFLIRTLKPYPSDLQTVVLKKTAINSTDPQAWYRVANWARNRGTFYQDQELLTAARELDARGIDTEKRRLAADDVDGLRKLAKKSRDVLNDSQLATAFQHEALWVIFRELQSGQRGPNDYPILLTDIARELPGATQTLDDFSEELSQTYLDDPLKIYRAADEEQRRVLHRLFYIEALVVRIMREVREDGSNGLFLASRIATDAPERTDLSQKFRQSYFDFRMRRPETMTHAEMIELSDAYEKQGDKGTGLAIRRAWLISREDSRRSEGAAGLIRLAEDWIELLDDRQAATKFYLAAWEEDPENAAVKQWLSDNDYVLINGKWIAKTDVPRTPEGKLDRAIREGRVALGMTDDQVRAAMGVEPSSILRFATNGAITELWVYEGSGIAVRLSRRRRADVSKAVAIDEIRTGPSR